MELRWVRYKDLYFIHLPSLHYRELAVRVQYYLHKGGPATFDELVARVGEGIALEPNEKLFVRRYLQKLKAYGFVNERDGKYVSTGVAVPTRIVQELVAAIRDELELFFSKRTVKAWIRGERHPDLQRLMEVFTNGRV